MSNDEAGVPLESSVAADLARLILKTDYEDLPDSAVHWAKIAIADTIAVTLAGSAEPCSQIARALPGGCTAAGESLVLGTDKRTAPLEAAFANGVASHALDFDDLLVVMGGHPSVPIVPALLALADGERVSGRDFLAAYVAGFEAESRLSHAMNFEHYERGWHPTATLGTFGAVAASARLLRLPADRTAIAIGIAASLAAGVKANMGTMTKPLHVGQCVRNGLLAALLARDGFTANPGALEHKLGFFEVYNGSGAYRAEAATSGWGAPFELVDPGVIIKLYPCCGSTHSAIDAMLAIRNAHGIAPQDVRRIDIHTEARRLAHTSRPRPKSGLDAKFSVEYVVARALMEGNVRLDHFEGNAHADPAALDLLERVHASPPTDMPTDGEPFGAHVVAQTRDGATLEAHIRRPYAGGPEDPPSMEQLRAKFDDCARRALPADRLEETARLCAALETLDDVRSLTAAMAAPESAARAAAE